MPRKEWTAEERKAWGEKMKELREAKTIKVEPQLKKPNVPRPDFVSVYLWNAWLRDNGFEVEV